MLALPAQAKIDRLVVKIDQSFVFQSDLEATLAAFQKMDCLMGGSTMAEKFNFSPVATKNLPVYWIGDQVLKKEIVRLYMIHQLLGTEAQNKFQVPFLQKLLAPNLKRCGVDQFSKLNALTLSMIESELHFQEFYNLSADVAAQKSPDDLNSSFSLSYRTLEERLKAYQIQFYN